MIEKKLQLLGVEYRDEDKYYTTCPKCSDSRGKGDRKTLLVTRDDNVVRYRCMHADQCEWNDGKYFYIKPSSTHSTPKQHLVYTDPVPEGMTPQVPEGSILYPYKDVNGQILFFVIRLDNPDGSKAIYPMVYKDGKFAYEGYRGKALYGAETLKDKEVVLVVEGEKTANAARDIFTKAAVVTWQGGCNGVNKGDWNLLNNNSFKEIILWPDNDEPGKKAMELVRSFLPKANVSMINPQVLDKGADLADNIPKDIIKELFSKRVNLSTKTEVSTVKPSHLTPESFLSNLTIAKAGLGLGWATLDRNLRLPQTGLVVIAGRTGHGKTSLMVNLAVNLLQQTDKKVVYYSYEIPATRLLIKTIQTMHGEAFDPNPYKNIEAYIDRISANSLSTWDNLRPLLNTRFLLTDEPDDITTLCNKLDKPEFENSIVFVDYIQLIPGSAKDSRYLTIKNHADSLRAVANKRKMVIVTGSQMTNGETPYQDSVREGKDIENAAELVLRVWNKPVARATGAVKRGKVDGEETEVDYYDDTPGDFVIAVVKNRNACSGTRYGMTLKNGATLLEAKQSESTSMEF